MSKRWVAEVRGEVHPVGGGDELHGAGVVALIFLSRLARAMRPPLLEISRLRSPLDSFTVVESPRR